MPIRTVIAEDNWLTPAVLRQELESRDYQVVGIARTGTEALELCRREQPEVVLMDIRMPGMDGVEVTRVLMEESPTCIVMVTGDASLSQTSDEAGAMGYLVKPFLPDEIIRAVGGALRRFTWFQRVLAEAGSTQDALAAWQAVRRAIRAMSESARVPEGEAFIRIQQAALEQDLPLHQVAEALAPCARQPQA